MIWFEIRVRFDNDWHVCGTRYRSLDQAMTRAEGYRKKGYGDAVGVVKVIEEEIAVIENDKPDN